MPGNGTSVTGGDGVGGSGYWIGDHYVLTAGHVVYEWTNFGHFPVTIDDGGLNVVLDYRNHKTTYTNPMTGRQGKTSGFDRRIYESLVNARGELKEPWNLGGGRPSLASRGRALSRRQKEALKW